MSSCFAGGSLSLFQQELQLPREVTLEGGEAVSGGTFWGDKTYLMVRWAPSPQVHLRFLYSKQFFTGGFAGMNGELGVSF